MYKKMKENEDKKHNKQIKKIIKNRKEQ